MKTIEYKGIKVHNYGKLPADYPYYEVSDLNKWDLDKVVNVGVDEVWYWYGIGSYEGSGDILMRKGHKYDLNSMGHCSCYGPTDSLSFNGRTFKQLKKSCSEGYLKSVSCLLDLAEKSINKQKEEVKYK